MVPRIAGVSDDAEANFNSTKTSTTIKTWLTLPKEQTKAVIVWQFMLQFMGYLDPGLHFPASRMPTL